jgi:hypothetical protein
VEESGGNIVIRGSNLMRRIQRCFTLMPIVCLLASGCQSESLPGTVVEQRISADPVEIRAADPGVFALWRWSDGPPLRGDDPDASSKSAGNRPVEIREVYVASGSPVGFERTSDRLEAIAGTETIWLEEGHYVWTAQTAVEQEKDAKSTAINFWVSWWYWTSLPFAFWVWTRGGMAN